MKIRAEFVDKELGEIDTCGGGAYLGQIYYNRSKLREQIRGVGSFGLIYIYIYI